MIREVTKPPCCVTFENAVKLLNLSVFNKQDREFPTIKRMDVLRSHVVGTILVRPKVTKLVLTSIVSADLIRMLAQPLLARNPRFKNLTWLRSP